MKKLLIIILLSSLSNAINADDYIKCVKECFRKNLADKVARKECVKECGDLHKTEPYFPGPGELIPPPGEKGEKPLVRYPEGGAPAVEPYDPDVEPYPAE